MFNELLGRLRAAWKAWKDPWMVTEAEALKGLLPELGARNEFALLRGDVVAGRWYARIERLDYPQRQKIREVIGHF